MKIIKLFSLTAVLVMAILFGVSTDSKGKISMINTAKATQQAYVPVLIVCYEGGEVVGRKLDCEAGAQATCTPIDCMPF